MYMHSVGRRAGPCLLALLLAVGSLAGVRGNTYHARMDKNPRRLVRMTEPFEFAGAQQGRIELTIKDISIWSKHDDGKKPNWDNFGFFLWPVEAHQVFETELVMGDKCVLAELHKDTILLTFKDLDIQKLILGEETPFSSAFEVGGAGMYALYFVNCEPDMAVSLDSTAQVYNLHNGKRDPMSEDSNIHEMPTVPTFQEGLADLQDQLGHWVWQGLCSIYKKIGVPRRNS